MSVGHQVSFEWALPGALSLAETGATVAVVVDVLSFSTAVSVACDRDAAVYPFAWRDERAAAYASQVGAALAGPRRAPGLSLSPASIRSAPELGALVLPSPNGSSISSALQGKRCVVVAGCLRNAAAVASYLAEHLAEHMDGHAADNPARGEPPAGRVRWP